MHTRASSALQRARKESWPPFSNFENWCNSVRWKLSKRTEGNSSQKFYQIVLSYCVEPFQNILALDRHHIEFESRSLPEAKDCQHSARWCPSSVN